MTTLNVLWNSKCSDLFPWKGSREQNATPRAIPLPPAGTGGLYGVPTAQPQDSEGSEGVSDVGCGKKHAVPSTRGVPLRRRYLSEQRGMRLQRRNR